MGHYDHHWKEVTLS
ncbi:hypothetical protein Pint_09128 [Pistacia integerrima]|uniref:Uncharacterized protein n=1 Tax=Pistacia integerrima TaxID=434235 RepID=A0ACC0XVZ0_9ROSI|nr:hypothetical protein Pint_09128 [Pistacia integerrima]